MNRTGPATTLKYCFQSDDSVQWRRLKLHGNGTNSNGHARYLEGGKLHLWANF